MLLFSQCKKEHPVKQPISTTDSIRDKNILTLAEAREVASFSNASAGRSNADSTENRPIEPNEITDQVTLIDSTDSSPLLYIFKKKKGFIIVAADLRVMPILAFSENSEIDVRNVPNGVSLWIDMAKTKIREARLSGSEPDDIVAKEWQKFLSRKLRIQHTNCIEW